MQVIGFPAISLLQLLPLFVGIVVDHVAYQIQPEGYLCRIRHEIAFLLLATLVEEGKGLRFGGDANVLTRIATMEDQLFALNLRVDDALVEDEHLGAVAALQLVVRHLELAHLAELALVVDIELREGRGKI